MSHPSLSPPEAYTHKLAASIPGFAEAPDWPSLSLAWLLTHPDACAGRTLDRELWIYEDVVERYYTSGLAKVVAAAKVTRSAA